MSRRAGFPDSIWCASTGGTIENAMDGWPNPAARLTPAWWSRRMKPRLPPWWSVAVGGNSFGRGEIDFCSIQCLKRLKACPRQMGKRSSVQNSVDWSCLRFLPDYIGLVRDARSPPPLRTALNPVGVAGRLARLFGLDLLPGAQPRGTTGKRLKSGDVSG